MVSIILLTIFWIVMWKTILGNLTIFNPWVNSYTSIAFNILFIIAFIIGMIVNHSESIEILAIVIVLWISAIIDRILDIREVSNFDEAMDYGDNFIYRIKVMVSFHTLGLGRVVFLLWRIVFIPLILAKNVRTDVKMIEKNKIMPQDISSWYIYRLRFYRFLFAERHLYTKYIPKLRSLIEKKMQKGIILSNAQIVDEIIGEINEEEKKLSAKERERKINVAEKAAKKGDANELLQLMRGYSPSDYYAYIDVHFYNKCKQKISKTLLGRGTFSPRDIMSLAGLDSLTALHKDALTRDRSEKMVQYVVIYILKKLKQEGVVIEERLSDDIWDAYQYTHVQGVARVCIDADNDPRFALDD